MDLFEQDKRRVIVLLVEENRVFPVVEAGPDKTLSCNTTEVEIGGDATSIGSVYEYNWLVLEGGPLTSPSTRKTTVKHPGTYLLNVLDTFIHDHFLLLLLIHPFIVQILL